MAISVVQHKSSTATGASLGVAFTNPPAANSLLICVCYSFQTVNAATDSPLANTWSNAANFAVPGGGNIRIDYAINSGSGADTVTGHIASSDDIHVHIYEVSGIATTTPLDKTGTNNAVSASQTVSTSATITASDEYVIAAFGDINHNTTYTIGSGYSDGENTGNGGSDTLFTEDKIVTSASGTTQTATATDGAGSSAYGAVIATFKAAAGASFAPDEDFWQGPMPPTIEPNITIWQ